MKNCFKLFFLFFFGVNIFCFSQKYEQAKDKNVGEIVFDPSVDDVKFTKCNEDSPYQYYNIFNGFQYNGEKFEILKLWKNTENAVSEKTDKKETKEISFLRFKKADNNITPSKNSGYITIKFLINCEGKSGLFRVQQTDENYNETTFDKAIVNKILNFVKNLNGWVHGEYEGKKVDYYQYLTFKIESNEIKEILP